MSQPLSSSVLPQQPVASAASTTARISDEKTDTGGNCSGDQMPSFRESMKQASQEEAQGRSFASEPQSEDGRFKHAGSQALTEEVKNLPDESVDVTKVGSTLTGAFESLSPNPAKSTGLIHEGESSHGEESVSPQFLNGAEVLKQASLEENVTYRLNRSLVGLDQSSLSLSDSTDVFEPEMNVASSGVQGLASFLPLKSATAFVNSSDLGKSTRLASQDMLQLKSAQLDVNSARLSASLGHSQSDAQLAELNLKSAGFSGLSPGEVDTSLSKVSKQSTVKQGSEFIALSDATQAMDKMLKADGNRSTSSNLITRVDSQSVSDSLINVQTDAPSSQSSLSPSALSTPISGRTSIPVNVSFSQPQWGAAVAEKAVWAAAQNIQSVDIQLDPPELGPLQIKVHVHQDQASVNFVSANPVVREALDQSMLRLKDMLHEQGMDLVDSGVSDQSEQHSNKEKSSSSDDTSVIAPELENDDVSGEVSILVPSGIDDFA